MGKGKKQKQLSPEEQRERAERRRMANGGAPPEDRQKSSAAPGKKKPRGHRQKGAGSTLTSRGDITVSGVVIKEWQRTPKQLLHEWTQKQKRPRPRYEQRPAKPAHMHRVSVYLADPKKKERSLRFTPDQSFPTLLQAQHAGALMSLQGIDPSIPHERKLPEPFRTMWLELVGRSGEPEVKLTKKQLKKAKAAAKREAMKAKSQSLNIKKSVPDESTAEGRNQASASDNLEEKDSITKKEPSSSSQKPLPVDFTPKGRGAGAPTHAVSLTTSQKYASRYERRQAHEAKDAARAAKKREREKKIRDNPNAAVVMSESNRMYVQEILASLASSKSDKPTGTDNPELIASMQREIEGLGFSSQQAALALEWRGASVSEALTWLMLNIPEEDLPASFEPGKASKIGSTHLFSDANKDNATNGLKLSSSQGTENTAKTVQSDPESFPGNASEQKLVDCGFQLSDARAALSINNGQYPAALEKLYSDALSDIIASKGWNEQGREDSDDEVDPLEDEIIVLESMFPDSKVDGPSIDKERGGRKVTMKMGAELGLMFKGAPSVLDMWIPEGSTYPSAFLSDGKAGCIVLVRNPSFNSVTMRAVTGSVLEKLHDIFKETGGQQGVLCEMTQWCEQSLRRIVDHGTDPKTSGSSLQLSLGNTKIKSQAVEKRLKAQQSTSASPKVNRNTASRRRVKSHVTILSSKKERDDFSRKLLSSLRERQAKAKADPDGFGRIAKVRASLPAGKHFDPIVHAVCENRVILIAGETGCGKTTQVPQFILDHEVAAGRGGDCNIVCTQPRRIAAIGVAERVAQEQGCKLGDTVGYQIRLDKKCSKSTRLLFCTTGILLRRMHGDPDLKGVSHVIVDEVHERNVDTDFLLAILRALVHRKGSTVKVVLMSATMDANLFVKYFETSHRGIGASEQVSRLPLPPPVISVPGFVYPVKEMYLEDILEKSGYMPRGAKGWRSAGVEEVNEDKGGADMPSSIPGPTDDGSKSVRPYSINGSDSKAYSPSTIESLQKLSHGSYANSWERYRGGATKQRTDYDLIAATVALADQEALDARDDGAILVFMSGTMEISKAIEAIKRMLFGRREEHAEYEDDEYEPCTTPSARRDPSSVQILPLHGALTSSDQSRIFRRPPRGVRKVVVATNIAETSITIDDCSVVIDTGRFKETRYDPTNRMSCLVESWVSQASARQRRGRAGRVRKGRCYRLYTRAAYTRLPSSQQPEMHRVPLENLCLQIRLLELGKPGKFLGSVIEPPPRASIGAAVHHLRALGAFSPGGSELTPLGRHLAAMPLDPQIGKMLVFGALMRCMEDVLTIAASLCSRSPFLSPTTHRDEANKMKAKLAGPSRSDHIALLRAYHGWQNAGKRRRQFCEENFLSYDGMRTISDLRRQLATALLDAGFGNSGSQASGNSSNDFTSLKSTNVLRAAICAGMYPNVLFIRKPPKTYYEMNGGNFERTPDAKELKFYCQTSSSSSEANDEKSNSNLIKERVFLHPSSVNFREGGFSSPWMVYFQKVKTSKVFIRDCTMVPPYAMLLFGGQLEVQHQRNKIVVDDWMYFDAPARVAVLIQELRRELDLLLGRKIVNPSINISASPLIDAITRLLVKSGY